MSSKACHRAFVLQEAFRDEAALISPDNDSESYVRECQLRGWLQDEADLLEYTERYSVDNLQQTTQAHNLVNMILQKHPALFESAGLGQSLDADAADDVSQEALLFNAVSAVAGAFMSHRTCSLSV